MTLKCDMCHKPLKSGAKRYVIVPPLRPDLTMTVGPECFRKSKKARAALAARMTPDQITAMQLKLAQEHPK